MGRWNGEVQLIKLRMRRICVRSVRKIMKKEGKEGCGGKGRGGGMLFI